MNSISSSASENPSITKQREALLKQNPDKLFGVYRLMEETEGEIKLELVENALTAYPNQKDNLKGLEDNTSIHILDLGALRKGEVTYLRKGGEAGLNPDNLVLLSNGVIEYITGSTGKQHIITTLRDGGAADKLQRTTIAGRNTGKDLIAETERELYEESPFLVKDKEGNYALAIAEGNEKGKDYTIESIQRFLKEKYDKDYVFMKTLEKAFGENFPGIKCENLEDTLNEIIKHIQILLRGIKGNYILKGGRDDTLMRAFEKAFERSFPGIKYEDLGDTLNEIIKHIQKFLEKGKDYTFMKAFERSFPGIKYEDLGSILNEIIDKDRFVEYTWEQGEIKGTEKNVKTIKLGDKEVKAYVFFDKANNTIEYRLIREITGLPEGYSTIGNRPSRLYLESENQVPLSSSLIALASKMKKEILNVLTKESSDNASTKEKTKRRKEFELIPDNLVPTMKEVLRDVEEALKNAAFKE